MVNKQSFIDKTILSLLLIVFGGVVIHAPLTVWLGSMSPENELLIKSWKEILLLITAVLTSVQLTRHQQWRQVVTDKFMQLVAAIAVLDLAILLIINNPPISELAGLMIGLRYYLYFGLVAVYIKRFPQVKNMFVAVLLGGALLVGVFSLLQVFVLPKDVLSNIGYSKQTIQPYLTVDLNHDYVRINSTFRGPNPLGAYAVIVLSFLVALLIGRSTPRWHYDRLFMGVIALGMIVSLWWSYSRSAMIGAIIAAVVILAAVGVKKMSKRTLWVAVAVVLVMGIVMSMVAATQREAISNIVFHNNVDGGSEHKSDDGHRDSLEYGVQGIAKNPLGHGIGSSGSASLLSDEPNIIENQYIATAWQGGIISLALTVALFVLVMERAWKTRRDNALALTVFASGVAMAVIGLVLPVWTDDTIGIIWWGLAAIVIATPLTTIIDKSAKRKARHGTARNQKTNRTS